MKYLTNNLIPSAVDTPIYYIALTYKCKSIKLQQQWKPFS